jgi:hypothetical protein
VILWLNFAYLWFRVYWITTRVDVTDSVTYLSVMVAAYGLLVTVWIVHNIRIYKKKGPRTAVRAVPVGNHFDGLQRRIFRQAELRDDQEIVIDVVNGRKIFAKKTEKPQESEAFTLR